MILVAYYVIMFGEVKQRRQWIMFKWNPHIYIYTQNGTHTKTCIDTFSCIHIYIQYTFHIKIHKLTAITISLSWFIHKPQNMSQTAHTTGGFILFYCVSCLHKNVVKHALFFFIIHNSLILPIRVYLLAWFFAFCFLAERKKSAWLLSDYFIACFWNTLCLCRIPNEDKCINSTQLFYVPQRRKKNQWRKERKILKSFKRYVHLANTGANVYCFFVSGFIA